MASTGCRFARDGAHGAGQDACPSWPFRTPPAPQRLTEQLQRQQTHTEASLQALRLQGGAGASASAAPTAANAAAGGSTLGGPGGDVIFLLGGNDQGESGSADQGWLSSTLCYAPRTNTWREGERCMGAVPARAPKACLRRQLPPASPPAACPAPRAPAPLAHRPPPPPRPPRQAPSCPWRAATGAAACWATTYTSWEGATRTSGCRTACASTCALAAGRR